MSDRIIFFIGRTTIRILIKKSFLIFYKNYNIIYIEKIKKGILIIMFIEKITDNEKSLIDIFRHFGTCNTDGDEYNIQNEFVSCEDFLRFWETNKREMMSKVFKDKLILKKRITVSVENDELVANMRNLTTNYNFLKFKRCVFNMLVSYNNIEEYVDSTDQSIFSPSIRNHLDTHLFSPYSLIENKYDGKNLDFKMPDGSTFKLYKGSKIMKTLGRFAKILQKDEIFEEIRIHQSQVMNEAKISANLCLSIHPLDYFTASYNSNGWDSCMHWDHGDYRRGVIEMMNSPYVIVAYLESNHQVIDFWNTNETWNSKKWREFIIVSKRGIFGIKGYPYWNPHIEKIALEWVRDLYVEQGFDYSNKVVTWKTGSSIVDQSVSSSVQMSMHCGPAMYNDFYSGNTYQAILAKNITGTYLLDYSGESECVVCGEIEEDNPHDLACSDCIQHIFCSCCGDEINYDDDIVYYEDQIFCRYCFDNRLPVCDACGETLMVDEDFSPKAGIQFYVNDKNAQDVFIRDSFNTRISRTICSCCAEDVFVKGKEELFKSHDTMTNWRYDNPVRHIIHRQDIKDIDELYYEEDLERFEEKVREAQVKKVLITTIGTYEHQDEQNYISTVDMGIIFQ